jgi:hypothetical protein
VPGEWPRHERAQNTLIGEKRGAERSDAVDYLTAGARIDFVCNVCGHYNRGAPMEEVSNRESPSCIACRSSLRMRSVVYALAIELFGTPLVLPDFPVDKTLTGLGMSDWDGYARTLQKKFDYVNTFYHAEPRLDITSIPTNAVAQYDFLISSDVFEHIPPFDLRRAFQNSRRLLRDRGVFIFTVPFTKEGATQEHFPNLYEYQIVEVGRRYVLHNKTIDGRNEVFENLIFHGGPGVTLEMRIFSEPDLRRALTEAGFSSIRICGEHAPAFGIIWPITWAVPIVARP